MGRACSQAAVEDKMEPLFVVKRVSRQAVLKSRETTGSASRQSAVSQQRIEAGETPL